MKFSKKQQLLWLLAPFVVFLTGCVRYDANGKPYGMVYEWLAIPTQQLLNGLVSTTGMSYALAIIFVSIIIRLLLIPTTFKQMRSMLLNQEKMALLKPYVDDIQQRAKKSTSPEEKMAIQQEQMELYRLNNVSLTGGLATGCLPILVTIPIFSALYSAIHTSVEIANSDFMGISLGKPSLPVVIATVLIYSVQGYVMQMKMNADQKKQNRSMLLIQPLMMAYMTMGSPAGIGIYFFTSGLMGIFQTWIQNVYIRPRVLAEIDAELAKNGNQIILPERKMPQATSPSVKNQSSASPQGKARKNSGKQKRS